MKLPTLLSGERSMLATKLKLKVVDVVYCKNLNSWEATCYDHCIAEQENPIYWFRVEDEESSVDFHIGIPLVDVVREVLSEKKHVFKVWDTNLADVFFKFIQHLEWQLKRDGIKTTKRDFAGYTKINRYNMIHHPDVVYGVMNSIFTNYTKRKASWMN